MVVRFARAEVMVEVDEAVRLRRVVNHLSRALNAAATDEGLTPTQASILGLIVGRGPISVGALARLEHLNPTMLSRVVGKIDEAGLAVRVPDPADQRSAILTATDAGRARHARIVDQRAAIVSSAAAELNARQQATLIRALPALEALADQLT